MPLGDICSGISFRYDDSIFVALEEPCGEKIFQLHVKISEHMSCIDRFDTTSAVRPGTMRLRLVEPGRKLCTRLAMGPSSSTRGDTARM